MTEGRPIKGDGLDNLQDYVAERLEYGTDSNEFAAANRTLEQELADLQTLQQERGQAQARPDIEALINEAQLRVDHMSVRPDASQVESGTASTVDFDKLPPEAEARSAVTRNLGGHDATGNNIR